MIGLAMMLAANVTGFTNAETLRAECLKPGTAQAHCFAYIEGAVDTSTIMQTLLPADQQFCVPAETTLVRIKDSTLRYLKDHPGDGDLSGGMVVTLALRQDFPCPKS